MLARRTTVPPTQAVAPPDPAGGPCAAPAASGQEPPIASPVHGLRAGLAGGPGSRRRRFDLGRAVIVAAVVIYTAACWWGLARLGSLWLRHLADR